MKKSWWMAAAIAGICIACSNVKETPKGLQFTVVRAGEGPKVKPLEFLLINMEFKDGKDSIWSKTRADEPLIILIEDTSRLRAQEGIEEIWRMLSKGDSIQFKMEAKTLFEKTFHQKIPNNIDPSSNFTFNIGVKDIATRDQVLQREERIRASQTERRRKEMMVQSRKDIESIDRYLDSLKIPATKDSTGLRYVITKGKGIRPDVKDSIVVKYSGRLMSNGLEFDKSVNPVTFRLSRLIQGWQIGFPLMTEGSRATFYIPSSLGYGPQGSPPRIPRNANLIFDVELIKVIKQKK